MGDRLAHLEVGELLAAVVDLDDELVGQRLVALGDHLDAVDLADALEIGERHGREGGELDLVGLQRAGRGGAVRQHAVDDLVEQRLAFAPIVGIALEPVIFARLVLGEFERAGADRRVVGRVGGDVGAFVEMLGDDAGQRRQGVADQLERRRLGEAEHRRQRVGRVDRLQILEDDAAEILQRLPDLQRREGDVGRAERLAVMPFDAVAQLEGDRQPVGRSFPGLSRAVRPARPSPSKEASASGSTILLDRKKTPLEATIAGLRLRGSESAATVRRPPFFGVSSAKAKRGQGSGGQQQAGSLEHTASRNPKLPHRLAPVLAPFRATADLCGRLWKAARRMPEKDFSGRANIGKFWTTDDGSTLQRSRLPARAGT